jgi:hypothetical protein
MSKKVANIFKITAAILGFAGTVLGLYTFYQNYENNKVADIKGKWKLSFNIGHDHIFIGKKFSANIVVYQDKKELSGTGQIYSLNGVELPKEQQIPIFFTGKIHNENRVFLDYGLNNISDEIFSIHGGYIEFSYVKSSDAFIMGEFSGSKTVGAKNIQYIGKVTAERISN